jgi:integrase/recombinase XerC
MRAQSLTFQAALVAYSTDYLPSLNRSAHTRRCYTMDLSQLLAYLSQLGIVLVCHLEGSHLEQFLADLDAKGLAGSTRARKAASIKSFVVFLQKRGWLSRNLAAELVAPKRESPVPRFLSEQEYQRLQLTVANLPRDAAIIELLLQTGIRLSELANITVKDVQLPTKITKDPDHVGSVLICKGKGRKDRLITLNYKACRALKAYLQVRPRETGSEQLFLSKFRKPMSHRGIEWVVKKHLEEAGIERAHVHSLRHTFGTHAVKKGWNLRAVQEMMGHKDLATTSLYVSLAREQMNADAQQRPL